MKIADLEIAIRKHLGPSTPDRGMLRVWTDEGMLSPEGGGASGKHRTYSNGELAWALITSTLYRCGIRGASLKAAVTAVRSWNDGQPSIPITDSGVDLEGLATTRLSLFPADRPEAGAMFTVVANSPNNDEEPPHVEVSLRWVANLLADKANSDPPP